MGDDLWETIDWGDEDDDTSDHLVQATVPVMSSPTFFDRKETAVTARLSGSSAASADEKPLYPSSTNASIQEKKQHAQYKRGSWFDADLTKLVPLEDEQGGYRSSGGTSQRKSSTTRVENETERRLKRRQSDYAIEKRRVLEKRAIAERPVNRSFTKRLLSSVGLGKSNEATSISDDEELDVPFPTNTRRQSCF